MRAALDAAFLIAIDDIASGARYRAGLARLFASATSYTFLFRYAAFHLYRERAYYTSRADEHTFPVRVSAGQSLFARRALNFTAHFSLTY